MIPQVEEFHGYLTEMGRSATFGAAVSARTTRLRAWRQKISEKALRGLAKEREDRAARRWWLEEACEVRRRASIHALEIIRVA